MSREIIKGGKVYIAMEMRHRCNEDFELESATYRILDARKNPIETLGGPAQIEDEKVFTKIDTTQEEFVADRDYYCDFFVSIKNLIKLVPGRVRFRVIS